MMMKWNSIELAVWAAAHTGGPLSAALTADPQEHEGSFGDVSRPSRGIIPRNSKQKPANITHSGVDESKASCFSQWNSNVSSIQVIHEVTATIKYTILCGNY